MNLTNAYKRWAEANGTRIVQDAAGTWIAQDKDGAAVVSGAFSHAEAVRLYWEDNEITPPDAIRDGVLAAYQCYSAIPAFKEGFRALELAIASCRSCYENQNGHQADLNAQAWNRGVVAAILYQLALAYLYAAPTDHVPESAAPEWLVELLRGQCPGRRLNHVDDHFGMASSLEENPYEPGVAPGPACRGAHHKGSHTSRRSVSREWSKGNANGRHQQLNTIPRAQRAHLRPRGS